MAKAPVYRDENANPLSDRMAELQEVCDQLAATEDIPVALINKMQSALDAVEDAAKAVVPIKKGSHRVGYGIDKAKKDIACDTAIAILKQIKSAKGW